MHFKLGLISALAATASASALSVPQQQEIIMANEFVERNLNQICISTNPVPMCKENYVVKILQGVKVGFHCFDKSSIQTERFVNQVYQNKIIPELAFMSVDVEGRVEVPTKCIHMSQLKKKEQKRRQQQQQHDQRVELIENKNDYLDTFQWQIFEQYSPEEQYSKYKINYEQEQEEWQKYNLTEEYPYLMGKNLENVINMTESEYEQFDLKLRHLFANKKLTKHLLPEIEIIMPSYFSQVAKQLHATVKNHQQQTENENYEMNYDQTFNHHFEEHKLKYLVDNYETYKKEVRRIYSFLVLEVITLNQKYPSRLMHVTELVRKVWENTQKKLTKKQIERNEKMVEHVNENSELNQNESELSDLFVNEELKNIHKATRNYMLRILLAGLNMNMNSFYQKI